MVEDRYNEIQEENLIGKYSGEIPCDNCSHPEIWFEFEENKVITLSELSLDKPLQPKSKKGKWQFNQNDKTVTITFSEEEKFKLRLTEKGNLIQLDHNNKDLNKENSDYYVYTKIKKG